MDPKLLASLEAASDGHCCRDVNLAALTRWRVGGTAPVLIDAQSEAHVASVMRLMMDRPEPLCVIGDSSNLLFDSAGFDGVIMRIGPGMCEVRIEGTRVWAQAGVPVPQVAWTVAKAGLTGIEHTVGIPGTLGGLAVMNGGSQRKGVGSHVVRVVSYDQSGRRIEMDQEACRFGYRKSALQGGGLIVVEVELELRRGSSEAIEAEMRAIIASREERFPVSLPNCGSTFLSDPAMYKAVGPPGAAIEAAGLKGIRYGNAQISEQHANFIVNLGAASSDDILRLIALARRTVEARTGYRLDCEVRHVAPDGRLRPAHEAAVERWPEVSIKELAHP